MSWFEADLTSLAFCWRLDRRDGVTIGLTSHDRDLWFAGLLHRAAPGMVPSAIEASRSLDQGSVDLDGALTSDAISEGDLSSGCWDGARLSLHAVNWQQPDDAPVFLTRGRLGQVETSGRHFSVELTGPIDFLDRPVTQNTTPHCRAALGDHRCRVDLRGRDAVVRVAAVEGHDVTLASAFADGLFTLGQMRPLSGSAAGRAFPVLIQAGDLVTLADLAPGDLPGSLVRIHQGCDRTLSTCTTRFSNAINFQGEPHLPGNDLLTRYAG